MPDMMMLTQLNEQKVLLLLFLASAVALAGAYVSQYSFGLTPCILCLYQRIPYALVMAFSAIAMRVKKTLLTRWMLAVCAVMFFAGAGIAAYHVGVEQGIIIEEQGCDEDVAAANSIEELRDQLLGKPNVPCNVPQFIFLGLSMAGWNLLYSGFLGLFSAVYVIKRRRDDTPNI